MSRKIIISISALFILLCTLISCGGGVKYRDDVNVDFLTEKVGNTNSNAGDFIADEYYIEDNFDTPDIIKNNCDAYKFCYTRSAATIDEYAVFHVKEASKVDEVKKEVEIYMNAQSAHMKEIVDKYDPAESEKVEKSNILVCGNYILYSMFSKDDSVKAIDCFYDSLKAE